MLIISDFQMDNNAAFQATRNPCFSNLLPVKVHWNGSQTRDFPPVNSY